MNGQPIRTLQLVMCDYGSAYESWEIYDPVADRYIDIYNCRWMERPQDRHFRRNDWYIGMHLYGDGEDVWEHPLAFVPRWADVIDGLSPEESNAKVKAEFLYYLPRINFNPAWRNARPDDVVKYAKWAIERLNKSLGA